MKQKKTLRALVIALVLIATFTLGVKAADTVETITASLSYGITVKYNGEVQNMTDAGGNRVYPISYQGTTYLPIRAVSNMLGIGVDWDQATQTVLLGTPAGGVDMLETIVPYTEHEEKETIASSYPQFIQSSTGLTKAIGGETVDHWLRIWTNLSTHKMDDGRRSTASFNLGGKYSTLTFEAYSDYDATLYVYGDNDSVLAKYELKGGQVPQTFTVDLLNTTQLTFFRDITADVSSSTVVDTYIFHTTLQ